ncbi:permease [Vallitalea pronyensis]|uniref:Permease n=1 Tax=Vallitalea pronyensis TaxID=1348613 RepID=A0A8J8MHL2_9FIRM|nr:permease [Vallitalea pronyensis]QUI21800.1 permease [Vallitalea pronyensis]
MAIVKRYRFFIVTLVMLGVLFLVNKEYGLQAVHVTGYSLKEMALIIPPIFIFLGLLDVWVPRETMVRFMGEGSGLKGIVLAFILGSAAAGPLYGAFPIAAVFMKKGVKFTNILIFIGAWSTTKIPMFLFELSSLGTKFAITRLLIDIPGIIIIAYFLARIMPKEEIKRIYERAESL